VDEKADAGAMVSASHNPVPDNGIKFFSAAGKKVDASVEDEIEALMERPSALPSGAGIGTSEQLTGGLDRYVDHLLAALETPLRGLRVVLDCAYGAAYHVAPRTFREAGTDVIAINAEPDGGRINVDCGSTSLAGVADRVVREGADLGLAFDGDADRVLAVDERGEIVDGDRILGLAALALKEHAALEGDLVVTTVMANLGFRRALEERGIEVLTVPVGDRHVAEAMAERGATIGGEQSGHMIFGDHSTTGDGVLTGLKIAEAVAVSAGPLSDLAFFYEPYPQVMVNVKVPRPGDLKTAVEVWDEVAAAEGMLGDSGRVLVRASGTEPLVRVMVEAEDEAAARRTAEGLASVVERVLGR
jgi:phosphoglucosamine mutase